jgi:RHS repeat-associated protein
LVPARRIDEILARTDSASGATSYLLADEGRSTLALTDSAGALQTEYTYEPFGQTISSGSSIENGYQYTGRERDDTGLYYYRARYYHPLLQRFISEDPMSISAPGQNHYAYVNGDPIQLGDPLGLRGVTLSLSFTFISNTFTSRPIIRGRSWGVYINDEYELGFYKRTSADGDLAAAGIEVGTFSGDRPPIGYSDTWQIELIVGGVGVNPDDPEEISTGILGPGLGIADIREHQESSCVINCSQVGATPHCLYNCKGISPRCKGRCGDQSKPNQPGNRTKSKSKSNK